MSPSIKVMNDRPRNLRMSCEFFKCVLLVIVGAMFIHAAHAADLSKAKGKDFVLFYPAQMSWETLLTQSSHSGADKFRGGKNCRGCHEGEEQASGKLLVADKGSEPTPIAGKAGSIKATLKAMHDAERMYIQVDFDPGQQPDAGMDKDYATKVAVMIDDGGVPEAARAGCFAACHDNLARMASGKDGDTTKYLARSRVSIGRQGGEQIKPAEDLAAARAQGATLEYWQARLKSSGAPDVVDGTILEKRQENASPIVTAEAVANGTRWTVTFSRKLKAGAGYKDFVHGKTYTIGVSVHAGHTAKRLHYVSLEKTLVLDSGKADIVAAGN